jgi:hypothetical protein
MGAFDGVKNLILGLPYFGAAGVHFDSEITQQFASNLALTSSDVCFNTNSKGSCTLSWFLHKQASQVPS